MRLFRRLLRRRPVASCPIRALVDQLAADGWTVVVPFPIPEPCYRKSCGHLPLDEWARAYALRAKRVTRAIEDGHLDHDEVALIRWEADDSNKGRG
jgi:hypothetical protein